VGAPEECKQHGHVWAHLWKGLGWHWKGHISALFGINELRNKPCYLVGPPFLAFTAHLLATPGWHFSRALIKRLFIGGCG